MKIGKLETFWLSDWQGSKRSADLASCLAFRETARFTVPLLSSRGSIIILNLSHTLAWTWWITEVCARCSVASLAPCLTPDVGPILFGDEKPRAKRVAFPNSPGGGYYVAGESTRTRISFTMGKLPSLNRCNQLYWATKLPLVDPLSGIYLRECRSSKIHVRVIRAGPSRGYM